MRCFCLTSRPALPLLATRTHPRALKTRHRLRYHHHHHHQPNSPLPPSFPPSLRPPQQTSLPGVPARLAQRIPHLGRRMLGARSDAGVRGWKKGRGGGDTGRGRGGAEGLRSPRSPHGLPPPSRLPTGINPAY